MKLNILGDDWKVSVLPDKRFEKLHGKCLAITLIAQKKIVIKKSEVNHPIIIHELTHAYFSYMCMMNVDMSHNHADEFYCDFWGDYGIKIIKQSRKVLEHYK